MTDVEKILNAAIDFLMEDCGISATRNTTLKDLEISGMDSLDEVELIMAIEDAIGPHIEDVWVEELKLKPELTLAECANRLAAEL